jgi:uncharacterized membrane protein
MKKITRINIAMIAAASMAPFAAFANSIDPDRFFKSNILTFLDGFAVWFSSIVFAVSVIFILYAAFLFVVSVGNEERIQKAKSTIVTALVGITVALFAFNVKTILASFF